MRSVWKRNSGAPNLIRRTRRFSEQVRHRAAPAFQSGFNFFLRRLMPVRLAPPFCSPRTHQLINPNSSAWSRPVLILHRSTASWRATATIAFLRAAPVASAPLARVARHFTIGLYLGWKRTSRQASSTSAALSLGLPCLVTQLRKRVLPLLYSPGQRPV